MRIRQDFAEDQAECLKKRRALWTRHMLNEKKEKPCMLPEDCEHCERYICNACERTLGWWFGGGDGAPGLCDDCWVKFIGDWCDKEEDMEKERMKKYEQACVL